MKRFRALPRAQATFLAKRFREMARLQPGFKELRPRLLALGGRELVCPRSGDPTLDELLLMGVVVDAEGARLVRGQVSDCHGNVGRLWKKKPKVTRIMTGYALSNDGLWREHSWALVNDQIVETTERRERYFGFVLRPQQAQRWAKNA